MSAVTSGMSEMPTVPICIQMVNKMNDQKRDNESNCGAKYRQTNYQVSDVWVDNQLIVTEILTLFVLQCYLARLYIHMYVQISICLVLACNL